LFICIFSERLTLPQRGREACGLSFVGLVAVGRSDLFGMLRLFVQSSR